MFESLSSSQKDCGATADQSTSDGLDLIAWPISEMNDLRATAGRSRLPDLPAHGLASSGHGNGANVLQRVLQKAFGGRLNLSKDLFGIADANDAINYDPNWLGRRMTMQHLDVA